MSKRYFIRVFSMDEEEGVKSVLNRKLKTRVGNLEGLAKELEITDFYEALGVEEYPPYRTCISCSWLKRERGIEACEKHSRKEEQNEQY